MDKVFRMERRRLLANAVCSRDCLKAYGPYGAADQWLASLKANQRKLGELRRAWAGRQA